MWVPCIVQGYMVLKMSLNTILNNIQFLLLLLLLRQIFILITRMDILFQYKSVSEGIISRIPLRKYIIVFPAFQKKNHVQCQIKITLK